MCLLIGKFAIGDSFLESVGQGPAYWKAWDRGLLIRRFRTGVYSLKRFLPVRQGVEILFKLLVYTQTAFFLNTKKCLTGVWQVTKPSVQGFDPKALHNQ